MINRSYHIRHQQVAESLMRWEIWDRITGKWQNAPTQVLVFFMEAFWNLVFSKNVRRGRWYSTQMSDIKYINSVLADKKSFLMSCFGLHQPRLWDHNSQGVSATFKLASTQWWRSPNLHGPQGTPEIKATKQFTFKWQWAIRSNERKQEVKNLLVSRPKVLFSSLMQANSDCLPVNTLLAVEIMQQQRVRIHLQHRF